MIDVIMPMRPRPNGRSATTDAGQGMSTGTVKASQRSETTRRMAASYNEETRLKGQWKAGERSPLDGRTIAK